LPLTASAEALCLFLKQRRLYWGQEMPTTTPCHTGYDAKIGRGSGSHTFASQVVSPLGFRGFSILTDEFGQTSFGDLYGIFIDIIEDIDAGSGW